MTNEQKNVLMEIIDELVGTDPPFSATQRMMGSIIREAIESYQIRLDRAAKIHEGE